MSYTSRRNLRLTAAAMAVLALTVVTACSNAPESTSSDTVRIKFVINGTLGDKSFFDSAQTGLDEIAEAYGYDIKTIELGSDRSEWEPGFEDAAATDDYDIFVAGTFDTVDYVSDLAPTYPDKKFWFFDAPVDYEGANGGCSNGCENVYSMTFKQNEGGYLAGYLAATTLAAGTLPGAEEASKAGVIGAVEIPVITDFITGFEAGFADGGGQASDVLTQYIGGTMPFADAARAKEIAAAIYGQGAGIIWPVAGSSGFGVFESAVEHARYAIGIDADQSQTLTDPSQREIIITSILKNVGAALLDAAERDAAGTLDYGAIAALGLAEGAVDYVDNAQFQSLVPQAVREALAGQRQKVIDGVIDVPSAF